MKNIIIGFGSLLIIVNSLGGFVFEFYNPFNVILVDFSIVLSIILFLLLSKKSIVDGFKIGFSVLFSIIGFVRIILAAILPNQINDNFLLIIFIFLACVEFFLVFTGAALKNK
jgi:hypothetical protein